MSLIRPLVTPFIKSTLVAFLATLVLGRSSDLAAAGEKDGTLGAAQAQALATRAPAPAQLKAGESRVNELTIDAKLVPSPAHPSRLAVELVVHNPTDREIVTRCDVALERYRGEMMARVAPAPSTVWRHSEELELVAGATITRHLELGQQLSAQIQSARKAAANREAQGQIPGRYVAYEVSAFPTDPRAPGRAARAQAARRRSVVASRL